MSLTVLILLMPSEQQVQLFDCSVGLEIKDRALGALCSSMTNYYIKCWYKP